MSNFIRAYRERKHAQKHDAVKLNLDRSFTVDMDSCSAIPEIHCQRNRRMPALRTGQGVDVTSPVCSQCHVVYDDVAIPEVHPVH
ncbi:MAG: hypothetical protein LKG42_01640 [Eubacterium sp.]|jgi:hypothetical protein|nr:hypothetical protein [Eubacterium sp.]MCH4047697.1 hypothetical protein [Eubacterium sp.]MCH4078469.1 hypothetical protein [Eubacterium sp.]MCH4109613.1 hypothetical protein [Eubacterium sp.]MCI1306709.1 hypothetical protein [Eubacterium sp.]